MFGHLMAVFLNRLYGMVCCMSIKDHLDMSKKDHFDVSKNDLLNSITIVN